MRRAMWILWPAFVVGAIANAVFYTLFDPLELDMSWAGISVSRTGAYTVGFFAFWAIAASSSAFTCFLQRTSDEVNRCPLQAKQRPVGCPKRLP
ncbi:MAG: hypothetical protein ACM3SS_02555 [Rhodospirillaceae bacterium]